MLALLDFGLDGHWALGTWTAAGGHLALLNAGLDTASTDAGVNGH